jgi:hypothetical protein
MAVSPALLAQAKKGDYGPFATATAPVDGTTEVQTLTIGGTPTAGSMTLGYKGRTAVATWSATNATLVANVDAALESLASIGTGGITTAVGSMTAGIGTLTLTFAGSNVKRNMDTITVVNNLTGTSPTAAITVTTPGVDATLRGAPKGAIAIAIDTGKPYSNTGSTTAPTWVLSATLSS